jgi:hypothetical protein
LGYNRNNPKNYFGEKFYKKFACSKFFIISQLVLYTSLIEKGGGTGPVMPWQPAYVQGANSCSGKPEIDKSDTFDFAALCINCSSDLPKGIFYALVQGIFR